MFRAGVYKGLGKKCQDHALGVKYKYAQKKAAALMKYIKCDSPYFFDGRSSRIRTCDPLVPSQVLYQTEPCPEFNVVLTTLTIIKHDYNIVNTKF